jgi:hypothetical protein
MNMRNKYLTFGHTKIPLSELLDRARVSSAESTSKTSVIESAATIVSTFDGKTSLGTVRYKLRMRYPISEVLRWYREKQDVI